jgi:hypothetical protein
VTDLFASYGETVAPKRQQRIEKPLSQLDLKLREKQRLSRAYRVAKRKDAQDALQQEPRLGAFSRFVRAAGSANEIVTGIAESWLPAAPENIRRMALTIVGARCDKIDKAAGFSPLNDDVVMPGDASEPSCFFRVRDVLGLK